ncbi:MAG: hypothetical protein HC851_24675 [Acaryochloris sp. RU_4_1]|nr:hypothetical protein [Acaryochloris sp. RU_4_1]
MAVRWPFSDNAIRGYLEKAEGAVSFSELVSGVRLPWVAVWLGVLLGGFRLEQRGGFYEGAIWVGDELSEAYGYYLVKA